MLQSFLVLTLCLLLIGITSDGFCQRATFPTKDLEKKKSIDKKYKELGGAKGFFGESLDEEKHGARNGKFREYKGGTIF